MSEADRAGGTAGSAEPFVMLSADDVMAVSYAEAAEALRDALRGGLDVTAAAPRSVVPVSAGQLLLMPAEYGRYVGVKVASVAPDNPSHDRPRIQGQFLLMTSDTLTPLALLDGVALTTLRTPAVSVVTAPYVVSDAPQRVVVLGAGPQAAGHIRALAQVIDVSEVRIIARTSGHAATLAERLNGELDVRVVAGQRDDLATADVVVCATTASEPILSSRDIRHDACVIAVGSHEPGVREFDPALLAAAAQVVVEDPATAAREAGEVVAACEEGHISEHDLISLADVVTGSVAIDRDRLRVVKTTGMAWEDVVIAAAVFDRHHGDAL